MAPIAGYVIQWHSSLAARGNPQLPRRSKVVSDGHGLAVRSGLCLPFELFRRSHILHHRNSQLTFPGEDTESYYHDAEVWEDFGRPWRGTARHQSDVLRACADRPASVDLEPVQKGGRWRLRPATARTSACGSVTWSVWSIVLAIVAFGTGVPARQYLVEFVYPGLMLGMMRSFIEHRWGGAPRRADPPSSSRTGLFGVLFLFNNLHCSPPPVSRLALV